MNKKVREKELGYLFVVGGPGSSGSTTIAKLLAEHFSLRRVYGGKIFRDILKSLGHDLDKSIPKEKVGHIDKKVDKMLLEISKEKDILIESKVFAAIASRKKIPCTIKIWLDASPHVRSLRTMNRDHYKGLLKYFQIRGHLSKRYDFDKKRYSALYDIKYDKPELYNDIVIDTSSINEKETLDLIFKYIKDGGYI